MTIQSTASSVTLQGNGATPAFPYAFTIPGDTVNDQSNVQITIVDTTSGTPVTTILGDADYTINGISTPDDPSAAGEVTYPLVGGDIPAGVFITIQRVVPYEQLTSIDNGAGFYADVLEAALDWIVMQVQQLQTQIAYSLQRSVSDPSGAPATLPLASDLAGLFAVWDVEGNLVGGDATGSPVAAHKVLASPYQATAGDGLVAVNLTVPGAAVIKCPVTPAPGQKFTVKDDAGTAGANNITVQDMSGKTIDGQANFVLTINYQCNTFQYNGTQWDVVG